MKNDINWFNLDTNEAAKWLGVTRGTLAKWRVSGNGPAFSKIGNKVIYRLIDLQTYQEERTFSSTSSYEFIQEAN